MTYTYRKPPCGNIENPHYLPSLPPTRTLARRAYVPGSDDVEHDQGAIPKRVH